MDSITNLLSPVLQQTLIEIVGENGLIREPKDIAPYVIDQRKAYNGSTPMVVRPASTQEVSLVVTLCAENGIPIVPQGGNTGLCGGATPSEQGDQLLLSLTRMNKVRSVDPLNYTLTAEAGVILADIQETADKHDRLFPLSLGAEGTARIGGNLATNAGGTGVLRYGNARELVVGIEVVLPDGKIWDGLSALRKDNTGYDLKQLFIGSEGTLGVITATVLKLFPKPQDMQTGFAAVRDVTAAIEILARARAASDDRVTAFEWMARKGLDLVFRHIPGARDPLSQPYPEYLLIELTSGHDDNGLRDTLEQILSDAMERGEILDATIAESRQQAKDFWKLRETIPEAQAIDGAGIKHDISVPISSMPQFLRLANEEVTRAVEGVQICAFGHIGDGNAHYNLNQPGNITGESFLRHKENLNRIVHDIATDLKGSISAEHGIGRLKREELVHYKSPIALDVMRSIKSAIDPKNIMNPGKVL
ncbi:MAG: FAD-binding oxidoreductase [Pseudomonadota bacterium]|nr:FAD-binding oxidoreductase [Pseudomonadota bacterium]